MRLGVIAEGKADIAVIKAILKVLMGVDGSDVIQLRPSEQLDETDLNAMNFSNWNLVLESCGDNDLLDAYFENLEEEALLIVQIDTAERGEKGYDIPEPQRTKHTDWAEYSLQLRNKVVEKIAFIVPETYRSRIAYAIAIEETDAWLIPLFDNTCKETAQYVNAKERLHNLIGKVGKKKNGYVDTDKKNLNYAAIGKELKKGLKDCRRKNKSLDLFCIELEDKLKNIDMKPVFRRNNQDFGGEDGTGAYFTAYSIRWCTLSTAFPKAINCFMCFILLKLQFYQEETLVSAR